MMTTTMAIPINKTPNNNPRKTGRKTLLELSPDSELELEYQTVLLSEKLFSLESELAEPPLEEESELVEVESVRVPDVSVVGVVEVEVVKVVHVFEWLLELEEVEAVVVPPFHRCSLDRMGGAHG